MSELTLEDDDSAPHPGQAQLPTKAHQSTTQQTLTPGAEQYYAKLQESLPHQLQPLLKRMDDEESPIPKRLEAGAQLITKLTALLVMEGVQAFPSDERSIVLSRALQSVRDHVTVLAKKRDISQEENLNPYSPKFGVAFGWFLELFVETLEEEGIDEIKRNTIFEAFSLRLIGWEQKIEKRFRGVAGQNLESLESPFVKRFREKVSGKPDPEVDDADEG